MLSTWVSVIVLLAVRHVRSEDGVQPCGQIQTSGSVVPLGSPVAATCVVRDDCPLVTGRAVHILWRLDEGFIAGSRVSHQNGTASKVVVPSFNRSRATLTCCVQASRLQVVAGVEIRAGHPPAAPQHLTCQTNLTDPIALTCSWDPGRETGLLTHYTLHTETWDLKKNWTYEVPPGLHRFTIPRSGLVLFSEMKIYVKAVNELGDATSSPVVLEPVSAAKFDLPRILRVNAVPGRSGCLRLRWALSQHQTWLHEQCFNLEVRLKPADSNQWNEQPILLGSVRPAKPVYQCRLLHGTRYFAQIRVQYQKSPWSGWSSSQTGVTLETAPTGRLDSWTKAWADHTHKQLNIQLFWKPSKQFRANGQNVSYIVSVQKAAGERGKVCATAGNHCTFQLPRKVRRVYLSAVNAAGRSSPTEVHIHHPKGRSVISDVTVIPPDDQSLLVQWKSQNTSALTGYVVEWRPLLLEDLSLVQFEMVDKNQSSLVIAGSIEPYKPYGIAVYPRYKDGIGLPQTVNAYSREKAPSMTPTLTLKKTWQSHIELSWDEIPLDKRNGIIQSYRVFYWSEKGPAKVVDSDLEARRVILKDLNTMFLYKAFIMVSTSGGSLNGSTIHFEIEPFDAVTIVMIVIASGVGMSLFMIFVVMTCFSNHKRIKGRFWPAVPDPANSSIKRWTSESTQSILPSWDNEEPNPIYLSHLSFLDLPTKLSTEDDDLWLKGSEVTSDLGESICGSPFIPGYSRSNSDSVPYATVIFSGPCSSPPPKEPQVYLRSESTQPLLEAEESFSPKCYQNIAAHGLPSDQCFFGPSHDCVPEEGAGSVILWDDFPFLRALAMNDTQND
ncbi:granulocyte colony-stimulating factor receptor isoform X2 [Betta splendens]|nr:granulocyte colony-stimulating factor receptor isoform X2 [Betta splendens]XP_028986144.1 granulocyte colony-stimulating factor receptor isoform X2 [Betta splendens]